MDCRKYRDALSEAAAGTLAEERQRALDGHLARCAECAARLERLKRSMAAIDRALAESAEAEPSAELLRRLHERLAAEAASPRPRISPRVLVAASVFLVLLAAAWVVHRRLAVRPPLATAQVTTPASSAAPRLAARIAHSAPPVVILRPNAEIASLPRRKAAKGPAFRRPRAARRVASGRERSIFAEAKIPSEGPSIARLVELIDSGKVDAKSLLPPPETKIQPILIQPLRVEPISIPPLEIGGDADKSKGRSSSPTSSGAPEAGAEKEITP